MCVYVFSSVGVKMASDDVANLADSLAKTQVNEGELSYKGQGLKLDNAQSGELTMLSYFCMLYERVPEVMLCCVQWRRW